MNKYWSARIRNLTPYTPGEQPPAGTFVKLNTNENPYPPSPRVLRALAASVNADLRLYPDPEGQAVRAIIAENYGLTPAHVFLGNGSDEVLAHTFLALLSHDKPVLIPAISYSFYPVYCTLYGIECHAVSMREDLTINVRDYHRDNGGIVIPNPNAPTGIALDGDDLRTLIENSSDSVVVIDEAYIDFGGESVAPWVIEYPNLLVIQTLSKSRSLAGLRVGFAIGDPGLIDALSVVKNSFNSYPLDRLALAGAEAALRDTAYFEKTRRQVIASRERLVRDLGALGFDVLPSQANFVFARHAMHAATHLQQQLRQQRILVRHFDNQLIASFLRISIGTEAECERLISALRGIV